MGQDEEVITIPTETQGLTMLRRRGLLFFLSASIVLLVVVVIVSIVR